MLGRIYIQKANEFLTRIEYDNLYTEELIEKLLINYFKHHKDENLDFFILT